MNGPSRYGIINSGGSKSFVVYLVAASSLAVASTLFISYGPSSPYGFHDQHVILSSRSVRVWPVNWRSALATVIGFLGSAFGTVGGVGGGGIFVPMLTLVVGFDAKSAAALSKCMDTTITAARPLSSDRHEIYNCVFLVRYDHGGIGFLGVVQPQGGAPFQGSAHHRLQPGAAVPAHADAGDHHRCAAQRGSFVDHPQFPVALSVFLWEATKLWRESRQRRMQGNWESVCEASIEWTGMQLVFCAFCGLLGGTVGGLLGSGGGFILGPLLLEIGVIPQVRVREPKVLDVLLHTTTLACWSIDYVLHDATPCSQCHSNLRDDVLLILIGGGILLPEEISHPLWSIFFLIFNDHDMEPLEENAPSSCHLHMEGDICHGDCEAGFPY
ncbi:hypothetical protein GW17_00014906 [Ensete ventricosum]|nr:hypothetical protein GW17_00014906 [Ensete ventricosum]